MKNLIAIKRLSKQKIYIYDDGSKETEFCKAPIKEPEDKPIIKTRYLKSPHTRVLKNGTIVLVKSNAKNKN